MNPNRTPLKLAVSSLLAYLRACTVTSFQVVCNADDQKSETDQVSDGIELHLLQVNSIKNYWQPLKKRSKVREGVQIHCARNVHFPWKQSGRNILLELF